MDTPSYFSARRHSASVPKPGLALLFCVNCLFVASCDLISSGSEAPSEEPKTYRVTEGACGAVVFVESIGSDSSSAAKTVEEQEFKRHGHNNVVLEAHSLEVVDKDGVAPEDEFYAIRVLNTETGLSVHSVSDVITSEGDLYNLLWCPD